MTKRIAQAIAVSVVKLTERESLNICLNFYLIIKKEEDMQEQNFKNYKDRNCLKECRCS
ncbi:MAG: hypothetical protein CM15mV8_1950 [Caudoviricetes sp.]|nr:MAG: hypothetical protein CM15mV8_1950 [Caudoviricetes sp.]